MIYGILLWVIYFGSAIVVLRRLIKEMKKSLMDVFKLIQYFNLFLHFIIGLSVLIMGASKVEFDTYSIRFWYLFDANFYSFIMLNKLNWLTMIIHIRNYKSFSAGQTYEAIKKRIKWYEGLIIIFCILWYTLNLVLLITVMLLQFFWKCECITGDKIKPISELPLNCQVSTICQDILSYSKVPVFSLFLVFKIYLFITLTRLMKTNLNHYYLQKYKDLVYLMSSSVIFLGLTIVIAIMDIMNGVSINSIDFTSNIDSNQVWEQVMFLILSTLLYTSFLFYVFFNIRNIDFKLYIWHILRRYSLDKHYNSSSKFIQPSCFSRIKEVTSSVNEEEESYESVGLPSEWSLRKTNPRDYRTGGMTSSLLNNNYAGSYLQSFKNRSGDVKDSELLPTAE